MCLKHHKILLEKHENLEIYRPKFLRNMKKFAKSSRECLKYSFNNILAGILIGIFLLSNSHNARLLMINVGADCGSLNAINLNLHTHNSK